MTLSKTTFEKPRGSGLVAAFACFSLVFAASACGSADGTGDGGGGGVEADGSGGADGGTVGSSGGDGASSSGGSSGGSSSGAKPTCSADKDCDDGHACTEDACKSGNCAWTLKKDHCLIGNVCYGKGDASKGNSCHTCDPAKPHAWSAAVDGTDCDDGKPCTHEGKCTSGGCKTKPLVCGDDNPCTTDSCVVGKGCTYNPAGTAPCDDGNACTKDDACADGQCIGKPEACDDKNPCTTDKCDPSGAGGKAKGCQHTDNTDACDDGDKCTDGDKCAKGKCVAGPKANCDDGNACTIDMCEDFSGCGHLPTKNPCCTGKVSICDDGDPCTTDLCDPKTSKCSKKLNTAVCDDKNKCTTKDTCNKGTCAGVKNNCDDKNACTKDACDPAKGCVHAPGNTGKTCDDGNPCTKGDKCTAGKCKGSGQCACTPKFSKIASKLNDIAIGNGGQPGEGLNIDGKSTCAPKANCSKGIDNALGSLAGIANPQLKSAIEKGSVMLAVEFGSYKQGPIELAVHQVDLHASNAKCDHQKAVCKYSASMSMIEPKSCKPKVKLAGTLTGSKFKAGGKGVIFPFTLPVQPGVNLDISIYDVQLQGTVTVKNGVATAMSGILAGAIPKKSLQDAIKALPDDGLPLPKATILTIIDSTVEQDQDTNGDGKKNASSIALKIKGIGATLVDAK